MTELKTIPEKSDVPETKIDLPLRSDPEPSPTPSPAADSTEDSSKVSLQVEDDSSLIPPAEGQSKPKEESRREIWTGNTFAFGYRNGYPLFTIGPHCIPFWANPT